MDSPEFLASSLHFMTCLEVPVHLFGAYCIIFKTPSTMNSVKFSMLNLHFWSVFLDLTISLLTTPYVLFPALVEKSLGVLEYFNVSVPIQLYLIVTLFPSKSKKGYTKNQLFFSYVFVGGCFYYLIFFITQPFKHIYDVWVTLNN